MTNLQSKIKSNWNSESDDKHRRAVAVFKVSKDGKISDIKLKDSSQNKSIDEASITAISKSSPLSPMPEGAPPEVDIQFTFDVRPDLRFEPYLTVHLEALYHCLSRFVDADGKQNLRGTFSR